MLQTMALFFIALHVLVGDDVEVAGGGHEDVGLVGRVVHGHDAVAFHRRLQRADRVDLGDPHLGRQRAQRLGRALAHVAVAARPRATLPAIITSVARLMPSTSDSRQP